MTSGDEFDFTNPVHYLVKAADFPTSGNYTDYAVTVVRTPISSARQILTFSGLGMISSIDEGAKTIAVSVPYGTDLMTLAPDYTLSQFATGVPATGVAPAAGFTGTPPTATYTITAQDGSTQPYLVTVAVRAQLALPVTDGLACWYDASAGVTANESGVVQTWDDLSGFEHHATVAGGSVVLAANAVHSRPAVQLRGGNTYLNCAGGMFTKEQYLVVRSPNATWNVSGSFLGRASNVFLTVRASSYNLYNTYPELTPQYGSWATANAGGQAANLDFDNDGMPNGVEYFMGATGSSFTPNPAIDSTGKISWPHSASATGITYKVLTSENLVDWSDVTGATTDAGGVVSYTPPTSTAKLFVRLEVVVP